MGKFNAFMKKRGLLLAAGLCVAAAGVAGVGAINGMIDQLGKTGPESTAQPQNTQESDAAWQTPEIAETPVGKTESGVPKTSSAQTGSSAGKKTQPKDESAAVPQSAVPENAPAETQQPASPRFTRPVAGEVMAHFSGEELLYNETMGDWRTHNGTDFAAAYGDTVCSITAGTVKSVREDVLWGWTVEVEGNDGLLRYTGLAHKPAVKEGEAVAVGAVLGKVDELDAEIAQDPHLHVEYEKDGRLHNVMDLLTG